MGIERRKKGRERKGKERQEKNEEEYCTREFYYQGSSGKLFIV